jgi:hypothetical protein
MRFTAERLFKTTTAARAEGRNDMSYHGSKVGRSWVILSLLVLGSAILATACSDEKTIGTAQKGVDEFHRALASGEFQSIWDRADADFRTENTKEAAFASWTSVRQRLGDVQRADIVRTMISTPTMTYGSESMIALTYRTAFQRGTATELFVWRISKDRAILHQYHVSVDVG